MMADSEVCNFAHNVRFRPASHACPKDEAELLGVLQSNLAGRIRVMGSKHAWSHCIETNGTLLEMRHFRKIRIHDINGHPFVAVGAGCQLKSLLIALNERGLTTPSVGLITEQTIAGATATGTHGSGKHSLSHYIHSVRIACFDAIGETAQIVDVTEGDELKAARCSLGCMGVVVEITLPCIPQYFVEEKITPKSTIEEMLALEPESPLQQFFLLPHAWTFFAQQRRVARFLAETMIQLFNARLHWGKWCPVTADQIEQQYSELPTFRTICRRFDPNGVFRNKFVDESLNLSRH